MPKCTIARSKRVVGYSLPLKRSNTSHSANRTVAAANKMKQVIDKDLTASQKRRDKAKNAKINKLPTYRWSGYTTDPFSFPDKIFYQFPPHGLRLFQNTQKGFVHWLDRDQGVFSSLMVPREHVSKHCNARNSRVVCEAMQTLMHKEKTIVRGDRARGTSHIFTVFGSKVLHGKGLSRSKIDNKLPGVAKELARWCERMEHIAIGWIPSKWLRAMRAVVELTGYPTITGCDFYAALASTKNFSSPAHIDDDFSLSIHQLNVDGRFGDNKIAQYFVFPTCGYAVALRPGDVFLFNPHVHHCISEKSPSYINNDVILTTAYLKNRHVSKNDKDATLTPEETDCFAMSLNKT